MDWWFMHLAALHSIVLGLGLAWGYRNRQRRTADWRRGDGLVGTVIDRRQGNLQPGFARETVVYTDAAGRRQFAQAFNEVGRGVHRYGQQVVVHPDPDRPQVVHVSEPGGAAGGCVAYGVSGLVVALGVGLGVWLWVLPLLRWMGAA